MSNATLLLPARTRFAGTHLPHAVARMLGRGDRKPAGEPGERAQLLRHFDLLPRGWPVAALTRDFDAGDAAPAGWLRADPAWVRPDINGARLMACGDMLRLTQEDVDALLPALRPSFGDVGFTLDAPTPARWYLRLPREARLPAFVDPADALGADMFDHLPGADDASSEARRWRALANEAQVVLHNHPWNARRAAAGKPTVNALWFWGPSVLPDHVTTRLSRLQSNDPLARGLAKAAGIAHTGRAALGLSDVSGLHDLRDMGPLESVDAWLTPMFAAINNRTLQQLSLDFTDGTGFVIERRQRWRLWRKPISSLGA
ncbi:MAG: phosphoglycerate mutase [Luteimonas sp.]